MLRLRVLRIVLPALLVPFVLLLVFTLRQRPGALGSGPADRDAAPGPRAERIEVTELWSGNRKLFVRANRGEMDDEGQLRVEGVERVEVDREGKPPLVLRAERGWVEGKAGDRHLRLEGGIEASDPGSALQFYLPIIEVREAEQTARSEGDIRFEGAGYRGRATALVHGLADGSPSEMVAPFLEGEDGSSLSAQRASFLDPDERIDLEGAVHLVRQGTVLDAGKIELHRGPGGRPRLAVATGEVRCIGLPVGGAAGSVRAGRLRIEWDEAGNASRALAEQGPMFEREAQSLRGDVIEITRAAAGGGWRLEATGSVAATGIAKNAPAFLTAARLSADLDAEGRWLRGEASGAVRFEGGGSSGEAARATFDPASGSVRLLSEGGRTARIGRDRTRISARSIVTDANGSRIEAEGQVEASLLASPRPAAASSGSSLFAASQAVHFVAERLEGSPAEGRLRFLGTVRGWQGERSLAADVVEIDRKRDELHAVGSVTSRFPRQSQAGASEADFVQVAAAELHYSGASRRAAYGGGTTMRVTEGSIEGRSLEADLDERGGARELRFTGDARFEMRATRGREGEGPVAGRGDRIVYTAGDRIVRLFGDTAPASVTQAGSRGGTTTGRVLRYALDAGTLAVEPEDRRQ